MTVEITLTDSGYIIPNTPLLCDSLETLKETRLDLEKIKSIFHDAVIDPQGLSYAWNTVSKIDVSLEKRHVEYKQSKSTIDALLDAPLESKNLKTLYTENPKEKTTCEDKATLYCAEELIQENLKTKQHLLDAQEFLTYSYSQNPYKLPSATQQLALEILNGKGNPFKTPLELEVLGEGNFGQVKKVLVKDTVYAAKTLLPGRNQDVLNREYHNLLQFEHPNINRLIYTDGHTLYLEFAELGTLNNLLSLNLSRYEILEILCQITQALSDIHAKGYRHGDVKSANILLTQSKEAKIADLGTLTSAKEDFSDISGVQRRKRSPKELQKIDIISFGGILWEFLSTLGKENPDKLSYYDPQNNLQDLMNACIKNPSITMNDVLTILQKEKNQASS